MGRGLQEDEAGEIEHRADALFALPRIPRSATLFDAGLGWARDLQKRQIEVHPAGGPGRPDVAIAGPAGIEAALASRAETIVVDGPRGARAPLRDTGRTTTRLLPLPVAGTPVLFVNVEQRRAARYGVEHGIVHPERWRTLRNRIARLALGAGVVPPVRQLVTLAAPSPGPPVFLAAARDLGSDPGSSWLMLVSAGSVVRRNAFLLFPPGSSAPEQVLKFARVPAMTEPFDRDERGAKLVASAGGLLAARAPQYLGRFEVDGHSASIESAAVGTKLAILLRRPGSREAKLAHLEPVARWLIDVAAETASPPESLEPERARLQAEVLPFWGREGAPPDLLDRLPAVQATFQHFDVAEENIVAGRGTFAVLDWEWAKPHGLPLSDLVYFGVHVLRIVDGAQSEAERDRHFADVMAGRAPSSPVLFGWIRDAMAALGLPPEAMGPLVTLQWLERGHLSRQERQRAEEVGGTPLGKPFAERAARIWLEDPALGPGWDAWRRS
jgi:hypothetical protein